MSTLGKVIDTFSAKVGQSGLPRPKVQSLDLIYGYGIKDDKFAGDNLDKTVMIVGKQSYDLAKENSIELQNGSLGENILLDFDPHEFPIGTRFKIGEAVIVVTENCTICNHLAVFDDELPILLQEYRGLYCKIEKAGIVTKNSTVELVEDTKSKIAS
ncbi:MOSC domain-containing protein [Halarcobacter anaerophilus]|uniref:MOSC domain-containing protein n=1 Tax=Halarcobacter anaerophilus TaxID=877500 RepID=UPI0005CAC32E|nr:MOSC domain-containing protein [Halarcobacter anaerophilus]